MSGGYEGILSELFYIGDMLPLKWAQLTKTVHKERLAKSLSSCFWGCMIDFHKVIASKIFSQLSLVNSRTLSCEPEIFR